jgi:hypothetical protein
MTKDRFIILFSFFWGILCQHIKTYLKDWSNTMLIPNKISKIVMMSKYFPGLPAFALKYNLPSPEKITTMPMKEIKLLIP